MTVTTQQKACLKDKSSFWKNQGFHWQNMRICALGKTEPSLAFFILQDDVQKSKKQGAILEHRYKQFTAFRNPHLWSKTHVEQFRVASVMTLVTAVGSIFINRPPIILQSFLQSQRSLHTIWLLTKEHRNNITQICATYLPGLDHTSASWQKPFPCKHTAFYASSLSTKFIRAGN